MMVPAQGLHFFETPDGFAFGWGHVYTFSVSRKDFSRAIALENRMLFSR